ncbi:hypothetical protein [Saccharothrix hoggarensis]|uniref:Membrane protein DUF2178 n=1 Tax=Saccharothrix hoggarensis TaxID=913853 RepID=A0ABW3QYK4_9PSEU
MSYEEKGTWVYLVVSLLTYVGYVVVVLGRVGDGALVDVPHAGPMLWAIGTSVVLAVVGRVALEAVRPSDRHRPDERDREVNRFGEHVAAVVLGAGMVVPLALALGEARHFWIANAIYAVFTLWAVVGASVKLVAYRRGF